MHRQQKDTDQSRADPAATAEETLKGPRRNKTSCSVTQTKTKSMLIINSSQGMVGKRQRIPWDPLVFEEQSKRSSFFTGSLVCDHFWGCFPNETFSGRIRNDVRTGWRGRVQIFSNKSFMPENKQRCISNVNFRKDKISFWYVVVMFPRTWKSFSLCAKLYWYSPSSPSSLLPQWRGSAFHTVRKYFWL